MRPKRTLCIHTENSQKVYCVNCRTGKVPDKLIVCEFLTEKALWIVVFSYKKEPVEMKIRHS